MISKAQNNTFSKRPPMPTKSARYWRRNIVWQLFQAIVLNWKILKIVALEIRFDYRLLIAIRKQVFMLIGLLVIWRILYVSNVVNSEALFWLERIVFSLAVLVGAWAGAIAIENFIAHFIVPLVERSKTKIDDIIVYLFRMIFLVSIWMIAAVKSLKIISGWDVEMIFSVFGVCAILLAVVTRGQIEKSVDRWMQKQGFKLRIKIIEISQMEMGIEQIREITRKTLGIINPSVLIEDYDSHYVIVSIAYKLQKKKMELAVKNTMIEEIKEKFGRASKDIEIAILPETNINHEILFAKKAA